VVAEPWHACYRLEHVLDAAAVADVYLARMTGMAHTATRRVTVAL
jgi:hypothetical protein